MSPKIWVSGLLVLVMLMLSSAAAQKPLGKRPTGSSRVLTTKPPAREAKSAVLSIHKCYAERTANSIRAIVEIENLTDSRAPVENFTVFHLVDCNVPPNTPDTTDRGNNLNPFVTKYVDDNNCLWEFVLNTDSVGARAGWYIEPKKTKKLIAEIPLSQRREKFKFKFFDTTGTRYTEAECEYTPGDDKGLGKVLSQEPTNSPATSPRRLGKRIFRNLFIDPGDHPQPPLYLASDHIYYVACEYEGKFDTETAKAFFLQAAKVAMEKKLSVSKASGYADLSIHEIGKLRATTHAVFGWYNERRNQFGFIAVSPSDKLSKDPVTRLSWKGFVNILDEKGNASEIEDWKWFTWESNGHIIRIKVADNDRGGAYAKFSYDDQLFDNREDPFEP